MACRKQFPAGMATPQTQSQRYVFFIVALCVIKTPLFFSFQISGFNFTQILPTVVQTQVTNPAPPPRRASQGK